MIKAVICGMNVENYISKCLNSLINQTVRNWQAAVVLDPCMDKSLEVMQPYASNRAIKLITNDYRQYPLQNIVNGTKALNPMDEDVIIIIDADDHLYGEKVLERIQKEYEDDFNLCLTYGSYIQSNNNSIGPGFGYAEGENFRTSQWRATHLRTYKYKLWRRLDESDFIDPLDGQMFKCTADVATMVPMMEMAGIRRIKYIPDILYSYNFDNPIGEHRVNGSNQQRIHEIIKRKNPYSICMDL